MPRTNGVDAVASDRASAFRVFPAVQHSKEIYSVSQKNVTLFSERELTIFEHKSFAR